MSTSTTAPEPAHSASWRLNASTMENEDPTSTRSKLPNSGSVGATSVCTRIAERTDARRPSTMRTIFWNAPATLAVASWGSAAARSRPSNRRSVTISTMSRLAVRIALSGSVASCSAAL